MNVVDSLIISLGLDASGFQKGQRDVVSTFGKTKDEAVKSGKAVEKAAAGMTEGLSKATQGVLTLMAAFLGGKGIKEFVGDASKANTALGNLGASLGVSPQLLSAFGMAAARMGGSATTAQESIRSLSDALVDFRTQGKNLPQEVWLLQGNSGVNVDTQHGVDAYVTSLAKAANILAKTDPAQADKFLRAIGIDPVTAQLMIQQGPRFKAYVESMEKLAPTAKDIAASREMTDAWSHLSDEFSHFATKIGTAIAPMLEWLADKIDRLLEVMSKWVEDNPGWTDAIAVFLTLLGSGTILLAIANVLALSSALTGLVATGAGLIGLLTTLGLVGAEAGALGFFGTQPYNNPDAQKGTGLIGLRKHQHDRDEDAGGPLGTLKRALGIGGGGKDINLGSPGKLSANQQEAYDAARGEGLNEKAARALVANMSGEGLPRDAHRVHWDGKHYAHGIVQWDDDRSAKIRAHFGKMPENMSVAEQTKAAIWEINNNPRFAKTKRALAGDNAGEMIGMLVKNYESPGDISGAIAARSQLYKGFGGLHGGAARVAALSNIANNQRVSTTSNSNAMHVNSIHVNAPNATDAKGIAGSIDKALADNMYASHANYGPY